MASMWEICTASATSSIPAPPSYVVHLSEDPRGFVRVHERSRIREVAEQRLLSHPLFG